MVEKGKGFQIFAHILLSFLIICAIAPFILLIMSSFTEEQTLITNGYSFFPAKFSTYAYEYLLTKSAAVVRGYGISFMITLIGTACNLLFTTLYAYPLSRKELPGRNIFAFYLFFTMLFSGGLVPSYLMWTQTFHIRNTMFALLIPNLLMSAFNVIMMRTYFTANIPDAVIEAARVDGANRFKQALHVTIPGIMPTIVTLLILDIGGIMGSNFEKIILLYLPSTYETADVISTLVYRMGITGGNFSYATAVGLFEGVIGLILVTTANFVSKKLTESSLW